MMSQSSHVGCLSNQNDVVVELQELLSCFDFLDQLYNRNNSVEVVGGAILVFIVVQHI